MSSLSLITSIFFVFAVIYVSARPDPSNDPNEEAGPVDLPSPDGNLDGEQGAGGDVQGENGPAHEDPDATLPDDSASEGDADDSAQPPPPDNPSATHQH